MSDDMVLGLVDGADVGELCGMGNYAYLWE